MTVHKTKHQAYYSKPRKKFILNSVPFLGAFAKLRKATISFVMSVYTSAWNNSYIYK